MGGLNAGARECPICRTAIQPNAATTVCPSCGVAYHEECWKKNNGCTTFMCPGMMQQQSGGGGLTGSLTDGGRPTGSCTKCGYVFGPMDKNCPRCARNVQTGVPQGPTPPRPGQPMGARTPAGAFNGPKPFRQNVGIGMRLLAYIIDYILLIVVITVLNRAVFAGMVSSNLQNELKNMPMKPGAGVSAQGYSGKYGSSPYGSPGKYGTTPDGTSGRWNRTGTGTGTAGGPVAGVPGGPANGTQPNPFADPQFMQLFKKIMAASLLVNLADLFVIFLYEVLMVAFVGGTVGKLAIGAKVVKRDEDTIGFGAAVGRSLVKVLSAAICCIPFIVACFTENNRAIHDLIASTEVISTRS